MYIIDNYSYEYKTRRILDLDKILLMMMKNLTILLMRVTGYCKQGEIHEICNLPFLHCNKTQKQANQKLASFREGIKREETSYPTLKDERYFDSFSRSLYITAKSHECDEVLDPQYTPSNSEKELFEAKQIFMFQC